MNGALAERFSEPESHGSTDARAEGATDVKSSVSSAFRHETRPSLVERHRQVGGVEGRRLAVAVLLAAAVVGTLAVAGRILPGASLVDGDLWTVALECDFARSWCPAGWGWGDWERSEVGLTGRSTPEAAAVYLFGKPASSGPAAWGAHLLASGGVAGIGNSDQAVAPFRHGGAFMLETDVRLLPARMQGPSEAQLLIRGGDPEAPHVAGASLRLDDDRLTVRYQVAGDVVLGRRIALERKIGSRSWHRLRVTLDPEGAFRVSLDGELVFESDLDTPLPEGDFTEPHLAVRGEARFHRVVLRSLPRSPFDGTDSTGGGS